MQPSHAWARTHTTQSPHATAASCHHCSQSRPSTPLGESPGVGGETTDCLFPSPLRALLAIKAGRGEVGGQRQEGG